MTAAEREGELTYRSIADSDVEDVLALVNIVQPHAPWDRSHFRWQFRDVPHGPAMVFGAYDEDRLVGLYCTVPAMLEAGGSAAVRAARVQDVMTHPDWRGRGILHALASMCLTWLTAEHISGYAFPNESSYRSFVRLGWNGEQRVPWWHSEPEAGGSGDHDAVQYESHDESATAIWEASAPEGAIRRDAAYLNWRYARPGQQYVKFLLGGEAVLVLKQYGATVHVCDLFAPASSAGAIGNALRFARRWAHQRGAQRVTAWLARDHRWAAEFVRGGMIWEDGVTRAIVTLPAAGKEVRYVSHSDNDIY
jgi:GNAT superfamily N-acetyltransferase